MPHWRKGVFRRKGQNSGQCRVIGVIGAGRRTGVTHLCVLMANYLTGAGQRRTAVIEWNDHGDFRRMEKVCARRENVAGKKEENVFKALGVTYFGRGNADTLAGCMNGPYDDIIIDFGEAAPASRAEWRRCQVRMMVAAFSEWQLEDASGMMEQNGRPCRGWIYLAAFGSEWTRREVERQLGVPVFRIPFSADAFRIDRSLMRWFEGLL